MIVLGVNDGHNSSASLLVEGKLICSVSEERFSRQKNHFGFPYKSVESVLKFAGIKISDVSRIAMSSKHFIPSYYYVSRNSKMSIDDYWKEQKEYWYPKLIENKNPEYLKILSHRVNKDDFPYDKSLIKDENDKHGMWKARVKHISTLYNLDPKIVSHQDHHKCHAYYGYFGCLFRNEPVIIYTMDGFGDGANGTVSTARPGELLNEISRSSNCNIGRMYRYATLLLGMRPAEHEYKLMGLAAYNSSKYGNEAYKIYAETLQVDGLNFYYKKKIKDHFFYFKDKLEGQRFDAIAYGIQKRTEEILTEWIKNGIEKTGISNVVMSGGVAQNIKANKLISEIPELDNLFIPPGPGDDSISIGAAYLEYVSILNSTEAIESFGDAYMGTSYTDSEIKKEIDMGIPDGYKVRKVNYDEVAQYIEKGDIVARFGVGRMEFGSRALGNRSILADPRKQSVIHHINKLVKMRDFWMPFAPSIIEEREHDYMINPKKIDARYMQIGFDSTPLAEKHISAGLHPFDRTARPQIVREKDNKEYYLLIKAFEKITGVGALLNTSFNIHGEPIVGTPFDAIDTFLRCVLHHLIIGKWFISKE